MPEQAADEKLTILELYFRQFSQIKLGLKF